MAILQAPSCTLSSSSTDAARQLRSISSFVQTASLGASFRRSFQLKYRTIQRRPVLCSLQSEEPEGCSENGTANSDGNGGNGLSFAPYAVIAGLGALGFAETTYLTFEKLFGGTVSCPIGGGSCNDVLNSDYSLVFGVPLSAVGVVAYGTVALLGVLGASNTSYKVAGVDVVRWLLLGTTGAMASASIYFMYILSTKLQGASCAYCVASALLSVSLLLLTLRVRGSSFDKLGTWIAHVC